MINGLEDLNVEFLGSGRVERHTEHHEGVSEALHTDPDRSVAPVRPLRFRHGVVVDVDDAVEIECDDFSDIVQLLEVVLAVGNKCGECNRCKVTDRGLIW